MFKIKLYRVLLLIGGTCFSCGLEFDNQEVLAIGLGLILLGYLVYLLGV